MIISNVYKIAVFLIVSIIAYLTRSSPNLPFL
ncbi:hypothetical protein [Flavisolibacter ginsengisoli]